MSKAHVLLGDLDVNPSTGLSPRVLQVTVLNGNAFLEIFEYEEKFGQSHLTDGKSIVVDGNALISAIQGASYLDKLQDEGTKAF